MKTLTCFFITLVLSLAAVAQAPAPQTGAKQPDAKTKPAEKAPATAPTSTQSPAKPDAQSAPKPAASGTEAMPKPSPEMERLTNWLSGRWATVETHERSEMLPQGGTGAGREANRPGPGGFTLISEYQSTGVMGAFSGIGIFTWVAQERAYKLNWFDNMTPTGAMLTGKWEGQNLVFTGEDISTGKQMLALHTFLDIKPGSFSYQIEMGPTAAEMKKYMTIRYTKLNMHQIRNRKLLGNRPQ